MLVGVVTGGGASASASVYDSATGARVGGPIPRTDAGYASWDAEGRGVFVTQLRDLPPGTPRAQSYLGISVSHFDANGAAQPIAGVSLDHGPRLDPVDIPSVEASPGAASALAVVRRGVAREVGLWTTPIASAAQPAASWSRLATPEDHVLGWAAGRAGVYLFSEDHAPNGKVLFVPTGATLSQAVTVLPEAPDRVIDAIAAGADGLYVSTFRGAYSGLLRLDPEGGAHPVRLPFDGAIRYLAATPSRPGATFRFESWVRRPAVYAVAGDASPTVAARSEGPRIGSSRFAVSDLKATSWDGVRVPLSVIRAKEAAGPRPFLLTGYGSYGFAQRAFYNDRIPALVGEGAGVATCHVRGGGEFGRSWRLAGKDEKKPNSWRDLIACAQTLVADGLTTPRQLVIRGLSAGGMLVGRAMTERPDLFAGVIMGVPMASALRSEAQVNGPANVPEFGSSRTEQGFRNLLAMDSYQAVRDGVAYPPVLLTTGANDATVDPWQPGKMAARLQASGTPNPVLLRVEAQGGHAGGPTLDQRAAEEADTAAFLFWSAGRKDWRPRPPA